MTHRYKLLLYKETEGQHSVTVPALQGCITFGENIEHTIEMAKKLLNYILKNEKIEMKPFPTTIILLNIH